jgi:hypothetical protein
MAYKLQSIAKLNRNPSVWKGLFQRFRAQSYGTFEFVHPNGGE